MGNTSEIERYLHEHIPLSQHMQVRVVSCDAHGVKLTAPLLPNINHRHTMFGGSASALAILAGWTWLHTQLKGGSSRQSSGDSKQHHALSATHRR
jgi:thioesterase domain-containing protein